MCYAIPGKVVGVKNGVAEIDYFGERKHALVDSPEIRAGDFVYAQAGMIVKKISEKEAAAVLCHWKKAFPELRRKDEELSRRTPAAAEWLEQVITRSFQGKPPSKKEIEKMLGVEDAADVAALYSAANELRRRQLKNSCCVHAIIEFSNYCRNDCAYCGIRKSNSALQRYRMSVSEIVEAADYAVNKLGFKALVLQSGEDEHYSPETLAEIVRKIREKCGAVVFVSVGEAGEDAYEKMWEAGARGALIRFETSDPALYADLHEGQELKERLDCIRFAAKLGFLIATGGLIGLPGQSKASLAQDILLTKELGAEMFSFGPFIPHSQTPLASHQKPALDDVLKLLAASRLAEPNAKILVTTALEKLAADGRRKGFMAGANSFMISTTPAKYFGKYDLYPGKPQRDEVVEEIRKAQQLLQEIGRAPTDFGV